ncbi:MAG: sodium:proton antiporter [Deltaproteobacteria bacterium]|nr:sodium:proton antiporter [Deltaproteobacteria bacterium]
MNIYLSIPFALLLLSIAILPLAAHHFWEKNSNKAFVACILSVPVLIYLLQHNPVEVLHTTHEYISFICLLGSLYVISGGVSLTGDLKATPFINTLMLLIGAVLANFIGTTGASMVLIRAFLKTNSERRHIKHLPVFFIFIVANCGGLLTPLGDPPLFLGFLRGVPFFWTLSLFPIWAMMNGLLLTIFFIWDSLAYRHETKKDLLDDQKHQEPLRLKGKINFLFLVGVMGAVFLPTPWRELGMIVMTVFSLVTTPKKLRTRNQFTWGPIIEVAVLFAGIFITMVPALMFLKQNAAGFGITEPWQFFWWTGALSGVLDNAPTYLTFLSMAQGLHLPAEIVGVSIKVLMAISVGAVFMGANTYIGNGPNFMIKAIADRSAIRAPSFFGYMAYAAVVLLPLYGIIHLVFLR